MRPQRSLGYNRMHAGPRRHHHGILVRLGDDASAAEMLDKLGIAHEVRIVSAHRTPDLLFEYAAGARARDSRSSSQAPGALRIYRA